MSEKDHEYFDIGSEKNVKPVPRPRPRSRASLRPPKTGEGGVGANPAYVSTRTAQMNQSGEPPLPYASPPAQTTENAATYAILEKAAREAGRSPPPRPSQEFDWIQLPLPPTTGPPPPLTTGPPRDLPPPPPVNRNTKPRTGSVPSASSRSLAPSLSLTPAKPRRREEEVSRELPLTGAIQRSRVHTHASTEFSENSGRDPRDPLLNIKFSKENIKAIKDDISQLKDIKIQHSVGSRGRIHYEWRPANEGEKIAIGLFERSTLAHFYPKEYFPRHKINIGSETPEHINLVQYGLGPLGSTIWSRRDKGTRFYKININSSSNPFLAPVKDDFYIIRVLRTDKFKGYAISISEKNSYKPPYNIIHGLRKEFNHIKPN